MEDYIGHDDLRHRLQKITDNVVRIREAVREVVQPTGGILGTKPTAPEVDPVLADRSVLVIDDEENIRMTVRDVLARHGCNVDTARDGDEAIAMINNGQYDLVVSDIRMPGCDGYSVFAAVKDKDANCPVIFMTGFGYDPSHSVIRARQEGLSAVLYKPFKVDQLLGDVRNAISSANR
jgi:DNA-binding NtrC family response regulator